MKKFPLAVALVLLVLLLTSCVTPKKEKDLDETLQKYEVVIRWSQWDGAADFLAPESLEENPITRLDMDRLRLFRVTQYIVRSAAPFDDGKAFQQTVEIRLFNKSRAVERTIIDTQEWRYEEESKRWLLHSGLPDVTKKY
jgi:hypothetical protein